MAAPKQEPGYISSAKAREFGLPAKYPKLSEREQLEARKEVLTAWFDDDHPEVFCKDAKAWTRAVKLWVHYYLKPATCNRRTYFFKDPEFKWDIVEGIMAPPKVASEPRKSVVQAPRGSTKTITIVHQCATMAATVRPGSQIAVFEYNITRTRQEMRKVRSQFEKNDRIHKDFGGAGVLFPPGRSTKNPWGGVDAYLLNDSLIEGATTGSATRGIHPDWIIVDDPEKDKKKSRSAIWRREYFDWLFNVIVPMLHRGNVLTWDGTNIDEYSCMGLAMRGVSELGLGDTDETEVSEQDERFEDWTKLRFDLIVQNDDGTDRSTYPDLLSVDAFGAKCKAIGRAAAMAEYQGDPMVAGEQVFMRSPYKHGFMKCVEHPGQISESFYFLDLRTGERMPWEGFVQSLYIGGANDLADSLDKMADPAATVFVGVDDKGVYYVLDVWFARCLVDNHVPHAFRMAAEWKAAIMGWEKAAMQRVVVRWTKQLTDKLRAEGKSVPIHCAVQNDHTSGPKVQRIIGAISPLLAHERIRFMHFDEVTTKDDVVHRPAPCKRRKYHTMLKKLIDTFTDQGPSGFIDPCDALEMAIRVVHSKRGPGVPLDEGEHRRQLRLWKEAGFEVGRSQLPYQAWTEEMLQEHWKEVVPPPEREPEHAMALSAYMEIDPYE